MQPRIVWFSTARSPYNDYLFSELARHSDLTVYHRVEKLGSHPWELPNPGYDSRPLQGRFVAALGESRRADLVVVAGWDSIRFLLISLLLPRKIRTAFWTDTPYPSPHGIIHDLLRVLIIRYVFLRIDRIWATGLPGCQALWALGCPAEKTDSLPFFMNNAAAAELRDKKRITKFRLEHDAETKMAVLCAGQLIPSKRYEDAIQAIRLSTSDVVLWIAGDGPQKEHLVELTGSLEVEDRVKFLGWLQPEEVALAMDACDVFLHPAILDPFPTVVLDAMSRGKPVIGNLTSGSIADRVRDGWNGYTVPLGDITAIADRINQFAIDRNRIAEFGLKAQATALAHPVLNGVELILGALG